VLSVLDAETSVNNDGSDDRNVFCYITKESEKFLSEKLLKERLEMDTLQEIGTVKNKQFYTKFIKVKTKL
jgi:THO complex subunit 2